jgi:type IV secretory pathway TrbL component
MERPHLHVEQLRANPLYQQMIEARRQAAEEHERSRRRIFALSIFGFFFWTAVSVALASWGMATIRWVEYSLTIIETGVILGLAGILGTLLFAYNRLAG